MPTIKLTKRLIDDLKPGEKDAFYWDTDVTGLAVKVTPKGRKMFMVQYRPGGRGTPTRKEFLGPFGTLTLHKAKEEAKRTLADRANDPAQRKREAKQRANSEKVADIANDFLTKHAAQNRTVDQTERLLRVDVLPTWGTRSIHEITKRDVNDLLDAVVARGSPIMANRVLAAVRKLFNWCLSRGTIDVSPCAGVSAPTREISRDRVLSNEELKSVLDAARQIGGAYGGIIQLLVFTAQRRNEVSELTWAELDLDHSLWTIPSERTKNAKPHFVHLSDQAKSVLEAMPHVGSFVFTTTGSTPFSNFSKAKKEVDKLSGVSEWRLHDIRRTVTTGMATLGIAPHVADKIMNHQSGTISGTAAVYQRHEFLDERRTALEAWSNYVQALMDDADLDNVVRIHDG